MLRFLIALLREGAPSVCYWVAPVRQEPRRDTLAALSRSSVDDDCRATESGRGDYRLEVLESENHAKECDSGLIVLDVGFSSASLGLRSIDKGIYDQHRL
jgi:hypothetical protein